jgi:hypothetical protein
MPTNGAFEHVWMDARLQSWNLYSSKKIRATPTQGTIDGISEMYARVVLEEKLVTLLNEGT